MRRTRYVPEIKKQSFGLNITSMTDMFTILLVFLLQNFAAGEVAIDPVAGVRLPSSNSEKNPVNAVKISISSTELKMDLIKVADVQNNSISAASIDPNDSNFVKPLFDELQKFNKEHEKLAKTGKVLFLADQAIPYGTLRKVMYTASMAGFPNIKFVTTAAGN
ncbi:MAG: biopolymer transporter ExbD [Bdellovibrio sp.]|nr:biopolymer transporter ExbD [Bdellovibrio sp.]